MTEVNVKPKMLNYQRNGIGEDGFYVMVFDWANYRWQKRKELYCHL